MFPDISVTRSPMRWSLSPITWLLPPTKCTLSALEAKTFNLDQGGTFHLLKELFEVEEGEFLQHRPVELATLLGAHLALCRRALEHAWFRLWEALREQRDPC